MADELTLADTILTGRRWLWRFGEKVPTGGVSARELLFADGDVYLAHVEIEHDVHRDMGIRKAAIAETSDDWVRNEGPQTKIPGNAWLVRPVEESSNPMGERFVKIRRLGKVLWQAVLDEAPTKKGPSGFEWDWAAPHMAKLTRAAGLATEHEDAVHDGRPTDGLPEWLPPRRQRGVVGASDAGLVKVQFDL